MKIKITMEVEEMEVTRSFKVSSYEDKDWNETMQDMYFTLISNSEEDTEMGPDRLDDDGMPSYE